MAMDKQNALKGNQAILPSRRDRMGETPDQRLRRREALFDLGADYTNARSDAQSKRVKRSDGCDERHQSDEPTHFTGI